MPEDRCGRLPEDWPSATATAPPGSAKKQYGPVTLNDLGTLSEVTADLHVELPTQVARLAVGLMSASTPIPRPGPGGGNVVQGTQQTLPPPTGNSLGGTTQGGTLPAGPTGGGGRHTVAGLGPGGGTTPTGGGGGAAPATGGGGGGGGKLPFTGYAVLLTAAVGASFAGAGTA